MYERSKLEEAYYFYQRMQECQNERNSFNHNLSAFLASARSVLQYAFKEACAKAGGQQWYETHVAKHRTLSFFKDKRDINIHSAPVSPRQDVAMTFTETIHLSASLAIKVINAEGNVIGETSVQDSPPSAPAPAIPPTISAKYVFADWPGGEEVLALSKLYLQDLDAIVRDGIAKEFLSP